MKQNYFIITILLLISSISVAQSKFTETVNPFSENWTTVKKDSYTIPSGFTYNGENPSDLLHIK